MKLTTLFLYLSLPASLAACFGGGFDQEEFLDPGDLARDHIDGCTVKRDAAITFGVSPWRLDCDSVENIRQAFPYDFASLTLTESVDAESVDLSEFRALSTVIVNDASTTSLTLPETKSLILEVRSRHLQTLKFQTLEKVFGLTVVDAVALNDDSFDSVKVGRVHISGEVNSPLVEAIVSEHPEIESLALNSDTLEIETLDLRHISRLQSLSINSANIGHVDVSDNPYLQKAVFNTSHLRSVYLPSRYRDYQFDLSISQGENLQELVVPDGVIEKLSLQGSLGSSMPLMSLIASSPTRLILDDTSLDGISFESGDEIEQIEFKNYSQYDVDFRSVGQNTALTFSFQQPSDLDLSDSGASTFLLLQSSVESVQLPAHDSVMLDVNSHRANSLKVSGDAAATRLKVSEFFDVNIELLDLSGLSALTSLHIVELDVLRSLDLSQHLRLNELEISRTPISQLVLPESVQLDKIDLDHTDLDCEAFMGALGIDDWESRDSAYRCR